MPKLSPMPIQGEIGSWDCYLQADVLSATALYREHPAFPALEAHVNNRYGEFTAANLVRVRGEFCIVRDCGTWVADQLPVEEIVNTLCYPRSPVMALPAGNRPSNTVTTLPLSVEPPSQYVEAAMRALPSVINNAPAPTGIYDQNRRRGVEYKVLLQLMEAKSFTRDAVEWAIHRHVEAGRLEAAPGIEGRPGVLGGGNSGLPPERPDYGRFQCVLWAEPSLWVWWHQTENAIPRNEADDSATLQAPQQNTDRDGAQLNDETNQTPKLTDRQCLILTEMLAMGAIGNTKKVTRGDVVNRIDNKKTGADFARDFGVLKNEHYTDSDRGPDGGVWLTGKGKIKAEELKKDNEQ